MSSLLDLVLDFRAITTVFQPVFQIAGPTGEDPEISFVECLSRGPAGTSLESPGVLFEHARRKGREASLDLLCIEAAFRTVGASAYRPKISVNVHASTLARVADFPSRVKELASRHGCAPEGLILEIVEHGLETAGFAPALKAARNLGIRIALDDIGMGQSNFHRILECGADFLKLDRYLIQGCDVDPVRGAVLDSLALLAARTGARIVAEGVETPAELLEVRGRGIDLVQGFLLSRPVPIERLGAVLTPEEAHVNVYCPDPECEFRGRVEAARYVSDEAARRCPECGASPLRVEIPGRPIPPGSPISRPASSPSGRPSSPSCSAGRR